MRATLLTDSGWIGRGSMRTAIAAPAAIASAAESADLTIATLEAQGFDVKVNRIGSAPLDECVVTDIRNPRERTELRPGARRRRVAIRGEWSSTAISPSP